MKITLKFDKSVGKELFDADCFASKKMKELLEYRRLFFSVKDVENLAQAFEIKVTYDLVKHAAKAEEYEKKFAKIYAAKAKYRNYNDTRKEYECVFDDEELGGSKSSD